MRKILILILTSNEEFYSSQYIKIKDHYEYIIKRYNLPMIVVGYQGDSDKDYLSYDNNIIYMNCKDRDVGTKFIKIHQLLKNNQGLHNFDIIIRTNTSTFLNLQSLNALIQDSRFNMDALYGPSSFIRHFMDDKEEESIVYPQGYFMMYSPNLMNKLIQYWDAGIEYLLSKDLYMNPEESSDWFGYGDDTILGACIKLYHDAGNEIELRNIWTELEFISYNRFDAEWTNTTNKLDTFKELQRVTSLIICKMYMYTNITERKSNEPYLIDMAAFLMKQPICDDDIKVFIDNAINLQTFNTRLTCGYVSNNK